MDFMNLKIKRFETKYCMGYMATCPICGQRRRISQHKEANSLGAFVAISYIWWLAGHGNCEGIRIGTNIEIGKFVVE